MNNTFKKRKKTNLKYIFKNPPVIIGLLIVTIVFLLAFFPTLFTKYNPNALSPSEVLKHPSKLHLFGTDNFGRDVFARVIWGTRVDLQLGIFSMIIPLIAGSFIGLITGYYGKWIDMLFMRILDITMAFPFTVLVITIMSILGQGIKNVYFAIWIIGWMVFARLVRAEVIIIKNSEYIQAARIAGFNDRKIIFRHILPNAISPAVVYATSYIVICMLTGASMSFLGLGVEPPTPEWGALMSEGRSYIQIAPWMTIYPGIFLAATGIGFSLLGDGITDFLRTKGR